MPFHIQYTGAAPISNYFLVKSTSQPLSDAPHSDTRRVYTAAFRGRIVQGVRVAVPAAYKGLTLCVDSPLSSGGVPVSTTTSLKRKRVADPSIPIRAKKKSSLDAAPRPGMRRTRSQTLADVAEDDEENSQQTLVGGDEDDAYTLMSEIAMEEDDLDLVNTTRVLIDENISRFMVPTGHFDSMIVWNPDAVVDNSRDEYICALNEWTKLADLVRINSIPSGSLRY